MSESITIRAEQPLDREDVFRVVSRAFGQPLEARLVDQLRERARPLVSLVAESSGLGRPVGHVLVSPVGVETEAGLVEGFGQLAPVSVRPEHQGQGIGSKLVRAALDAAREVGWSAVFVVGAPRYYGRFGFELAAPRGFHCPGSDDRFLQSLAFDDDALPADGGELRLHPAFDEVGA